MNTITPTTCTNERAATTTQPGKAWAGGLHLTIGTRLYLFNLRWVGSGKSDTCPPVCKVQKFVQRRRLVSIIPEIGRAVHLRRTSDSLERSQSRPSHPFESQLLNNEILVEYNLDHLERTAYDQLIVDTIRRSQYIRYLADALFFGSINETLVYFDCKDDKDLHRILTERNLWGVGNGGVVRGSYHGSLFFRYNYTIHCIQHPILGKFLEIFCLSVTRR